MSAKKGMVIQWLRHFSNPKGALSIQNLARYWKRVQSKNEMTLINKLLNNIDEWELWCGLTMKTTIITWTKAHFPGHSSLPKGNADLLQIYFYPKKDLLFWGIHFLQLFLCCPLRVVVSLKASSTQTQIFKNILTGCLFAASDSLSLLKATMGKLGLWHNFPKDPFNIYVKKKPELSKIFI